MQIGELSRNCKLVRAGDAITAASATDSNSVRIDMSGWTGVIFFTAVADSVASGAAGLKVEENSTDSDDGMTALTGASSTLTCVANDDLNTKSLAVSVHRPQKRYVQAVRTSTTANIAFGECWAVLYGADVVPVIDSTLIAWARTQSPNEA
jgi:hypothetical protein